VATQRSSPRARPRLYDEYAVRSHRLRADRGQSMYQHGWRWRLDDVDLSSCIAAEHPWCGSSYVLGSKLNQLGPLPAHVGRSAEHCPMLTGGGGAVGAHLRCNPAVGGRSRTSTAAHKE